MPFASSSTLHSLKSRAIPLSTAIVLSASIHTAYTYYSPVLAEEAKQPLLKSRIPAVDISPYTPLGWGSNRYLTLSPESSTSVVKRPSPLSQLGSTPLRDLVLAEKYGACVDAKGDLWFWGAGYDPSGKIGRSLKGKGIATLIPAPAKVVALGANGRLYAVSASKAIQDNKTYRSERSWWNKAFGKDPGVDFVELKAEGGLRRGEKFTNVTAGLHHLLAVTNKGRTFSMPLSPSANTHRQLGTRQTFENVVSDLPPESDPRFVTRLTEIPSLRGLEVAQTAASDRTSFVRTPGGRVLGWGANESGQIGLGSNAAVEMISVPVEVVLARNYPGGTVLTCTDIKAAGQTTFFTVQRAMAGKDTLVDLLASGNGMSGSLGNGLWSSACGVPTRVKTPLGIHHISVSPSPSPHVFAVLDTVALADQKGVKDMQYGKDVMVWGGNVDYQLGNGKRSSLAVPQHLPALVNRITDPTLSEKKESILSSGTASRLVLPDKAFRADDQPSPMPHSRLQLHATSANAYDLDGKLIKRNVRCEETVVAGYNASVLYNKIIL